MPRNRTWETVTNVISLLGECPVWHSKEQHIIWVDILLGKIHSLTTTNNQYQSCAVGQMIGAIAPKKSGGYIAALQNGFGLIGCFNCYDG